MVRFKTRHLLVEFLQPSALTPALGSAALVPSITADAQSDDPEWPDIDEHIPPLPVLPFVVPSGELNAKPKLGDETGQTIYRAIKAVVTEVYGDEGWGRLGPSFRVVYHSPMTTLTILRVSRQHYRLLWSAVTLLTSLNSTPVLPRVIAVSGTIKMLQHRAIGYHRQVIAQSLAVASNSTGSPTNAEGANGMRREKGEKERRYRELADKEEGAMNALVDA